MDLRNIAIIAHVDHGKTTLVDRLLQQSGTFRENQQVQERAMDSNDLERERGITILAKCTSVVWKGVRINIVDTPGHADFGGEVERILSMVDSCLLLVDAAEGPMPQTKFVLGKALKQGLRPIVVINKVDKPEQRAEEVLNEIFDLFAALDADEHQLDFPHVYASAKQGWAVRELGDPQQPTWRRCSTSIVSHVPAAGARRRRPVPDAGDDARGQPLSRAAAHRPDRVGARCGRTPRSRRSTRDGQPIEQARVTKILGFRGLERQPIEEAEAGDIVAIAGFSKATVADTLVRACGRGAAARTADRPLDDRHDLLGQ